MKKDNNSYIDDFIEMQEKQFIPGYYTGGRVHPSRRWAPHKPKYLAIRYFISAATSATVSAFLIYYSFEKAIAIILAAVGIFFSIGFFLAGLRHWKMKQESPNANNKRKRKNIERK